MIGARWVDKNIIVQKQRETTYQKHVQKVTEIIHNQKRTLGVDENLVRQQQSLYNAKSFNMHFNENQRLNQINKQNQYLLDKLINISEGKQSIFKTSSHPSSATHQNQIQHSNIEKTHIRAVSSKRKQAAIQIYNENQAMAQRLLNQRSFINKNQIIQDINEYEKLKQHMQKVKPPQAQSAMSKKQNTSVFNQAYNLPPIIQHSRNNTGGNQHKRKLKKKNMQNLNKSAFDMNTHSRDNSYNGINKSNRNQMNNNLNLSEADIIINQYDNINPIHNSNSMPNYQQQQQYYNNNYHQPYYQQSHSANIHNPPQQQNTLSQNKNRDGINSIHSASVRGSQNITPAIQEEDDYNTEQVNNNNNNNSHISQFYKGSVRSSSQSHHVPNYSLNQSQNNQNVNYSFDKSQINNNNNNDSLAQIKIRDKENQNNQLQQQQGSVKQNSFQQSMNQSSTNLQQQQQIQNQNQQQQQQSNQNISYSQNNNNEIITNHSLQSKQQLDNITQQQQSQQLSQNESQILAQRQSQQQSQYQSQQQLQQPQYKQSQPSLQPQSQQQNQSQNITPQQQSQNITQQQSQNITQQQLSQNITPQQQSQNITQQQSQYVSQQQSQLQSPSQKNKNISGYQTEQKSINQSLQQSHQQSIQQISHNTHQQQQ